MRQLFCKFHFLSQPPPSVQRLLDVAVLNLILDLCSFLLFDVKLGINLGMVFLKSSHQVSAVRLLSSMEVTSPFSDISVCNDKIRSSMSSAALSTVRSHFCL